MSIYQKIQKNYESLSKSEQRVAKYCLDNYLEIGKLSLAQLAKKAGCGDATILRFCRKLCIDSYNDFKKSINEEIHDSFKMDENSFIQDIYESIQSSITYTIQNMDPIMLDEIAKLIFDADKIFCSGVGNSGIPAEACAMRFLRNGQNAIYFKDNHFQLIYLNELHQGDIAILFSMSGESYDTLHCAEILNKKKIKVISITSSVVSSLAKMSDYHILTKRWSGPVGAGSMISQITQMFIADVITTRVGMLDQKYMMRAKELTFDFVASKTHFPSFD